MEDYEAKLKPPSVEAATRSARGKAEWEVFSNGEEELEVGVQKLALSEGEEVAVLLNGTEVGRMVLAKGRGKLRIRSRDGAEVPRVKDGDELVIRLGSIELLKGVFVPD